MTKQEARGYETEVAAVRGRASGRRQAEIAVDLGLTQPAISRALRRARRRFEREIPTELAAVSRREHVELAAVREEALQHWTATHDLAALGVALRASEQICAIWGIGGRSRVDLSVRRRDPVEDLSDLALLAAAEAEVAEARARLGVPEERSDAMPVGYRLPEARR